MSHYLKERFAEYMYLANSVNKKDIEPKITSKEDLYIDFEILYSETDVIIDAFSMTKKEVNNDFQYALTQNLSEVLEVDARNIKILYKSEDKLTTFCEITYSGKSSEYIKHEIRQINERQREKFLVQQGL